MGSNHEKNGGRKSRDTLPLIDNAKVWFRFLLSFLFNDKIMIEHRFTV